MPKYLQSRPVVLIAFAFVAMGDSVVWVAHAIEAELCALEAHFELLLPTMALVVGILALVDINYQQLVARPRQLRTGASGQMPTTGRSHADESLLSRRYLK